MIALSNKEPRNLRETMTAAESEEGHERLAEGRM